MLKVIDWDSVKLGGISQLGLIPGGFWAWIAGIAGLSTIVYNGIRIYKEFKNKP